MGDITPFFVFGGIRGDWQYGYNPFFIFSAMGGYYPPPWIPLYIPPGWDVPDVR